MSDERERIRKLRAKAADRSVTPEEAEAFAAKADELEKRLPYSYFPPAVSSKTHVTSFAFHGVFPVVVISSKGFDVDSFVEDDYRFADPAGYYDE